MNEPLLITKALAFLLPIVIFIYFTIIGYTALQFVGSKRNILQNILLAPSLGYAIILLLVLTLNRLGLPIRQFATELALSSFFMSAILLYRSHLIIPSRKLLPFLTVLTLALILTGRPLLEFGFDWLSYASDDMINYCLGATRFLNNAYYTAPTDNLLLQGKDYSLLYWFMHIPGMVRAGSELMIAWISGTTHLSTLQIFMPTMLCLHLMLISSAGALALTLTRKRNISLLVSLLVALSPLTAQGTLYGLIAQVSGLSLLIAFIIVACKPTRISGILIGIYFSALMVVYPELLPFIAITFVIYLLMILISGWRPNKSVLLSYSIALCLSLILLNTSIITAIEFLLVQIKAANIAINTHSLIFPYFLIPSGLANLWGLQAIAQTTKEPYLSFFILLGALLTLFTLAAGIRLIKRKSAAAILFLVMSIVGFILFRENQGFGLFKLSMYIQTFMLCVAIVSLYELIKNTRVCNLIIIVFILLTFPSLNFYVTRSEAITPGAFSEIPFASSTHLAQEYKNKIANIPTDSILLTDDFNISVIKTLALLSQHHHFDALVSPTSFINIYKFDKEVKKLNMPFFSFYSEKYLLPSNAIQSRDNLILVNSQRQFFNLHDDKHTKFYFTQSHNPNLTKDWEKRGVIIADTTLRSVFNRIEMQKYTNENFHLANYGDMHNHLALVDSSLGSTYWSQLTPKNTPRSVYNIENDPMYPDNNIQAVGPYLLFRILNPDDKIRICVALSNTFDGNSTNTLAKLTVIGEKRSPLNTQGRGSARTISEPVVPQYIDGIPYLAIQLSNDKPPHIIEKSGLMKLFNNQINLDPRQISAYIRDISVLSENQYQQLKPPSAIQHFPQDLNNINLEYAGIYEDGWIAENAYFILKPSENATAIVIKGKRFLDPDHPQVLITVLLDGKKLVQQQIAQDEFDFIIPVTHANTGKHKIELQFSNFTHLPKGDGRPVVAQMKFIGFV